MANLWKVIYEKRHPMGLRLPVALPDCEVSHMNMSCLICMSRVTYEWVMSYMNESCLIWVSHVTYKYFMSHINESSHIHTHTPTPTHHMCAYDIHAHIIYDIYMTCVLMIYTHWHTHTYHIGAYNIHRTY